MGVKLGLEGCGSGEGQFAGVYELRFSEMWGIF